jgi:hypothetical protein
MIYVRLKYKLKSKTEQKKIQNSLSYGRLTSFSAIFKFYFILKTCEKHYPDFLTFEALRFMQNVAKNLNI